MPVSDILRAGAGNLTPQQIADFALHADQERRLAMRRGNLDSAANAKKERDALISRLPS